MRTLAEPSVELHEQLVTVPSPRVRVPRIEELLVLGQAHTQTKESTCSR
jgi:hypothetical protein